MESEIFVGSNVTAKSMQDAVRILHIAVYDTPGSNPVDGTKELSAYSWLEGLSEHVGLIYCLSTHFSWFSHSRLLRNCFLITVPTLPNSISSTGNISRIVFASPIYALIATLICAAKKVDVVLATDTIISGIAAYVAKLVTRTPYSIYLGGEIMQVVKEKINEETRPLFSMRAFKRFLYRLAGMVHFKVLSKADGVFSVSESIKTECTQFRVKRIYQIDNFFEHRFLASRKITSRGKPIEFLCVSRLSPEKRIDDIIVAFHRAINQVSNIRLVIIGDGPCRCNIEKKVRELGLQDRVSLIGTVPHSKIVDYYRDSDAFVLASSSEGVPVAMLEAMATGIPVIVTNVGGIGDLVKDGINGILFQAGDTKGLTRAICMLGLNDELRLKLGGEARRSAEELSVSNDHFRIVSEGLVEIALKQ
jgi:glycosyltransferase involved in cell wall biosynthesis